MELKVQKRLAASILKCSEKRVWFDEENLSEIKEAITKADIRGLISKGLIQEKTEKGVSRGRARKRQEQKRKGRQKGHGSRRGKKGARLPRKRAWINKIRSQRNLINVLREKKVIATKTYRDIYLKCKGGFFRSRRHIKLYLDEHKLVTKKNESKK